MDFILRSRIRLVCWLVILFCLTPGLLQAQSGAEIAKLVASDGTMNDAFGVSVAVSGDTLVAGAYNADDYSPYGGLGQAYVYVRDNEGNWTERAKLIASDREANDKLGRVVSISGDTVVLGAPDEDNGARFNAGSAYVFVKPPGGWAGTLTESAKLGASDMMPYDVFGSSVSVSGDTVVVGAPRTDEGEWYMGSVYVFVKPAGGWAGYLREDAKLLASDRTFNDHLGQSVSICGSTVVAGAFYDDGNDTRSGSAYVFVEPEGGWVGTLNESAKLLASDGAYNDLFGYAISVSADTAVVGAYGDDNRKGSAYVFAKPAGGWSGYLNESVKLSASDGEEIDSFGLSVSVSGEIAIVGAHADDAHRGSAYVFVRDGQGTWSEEVKLLASDGEARDSFGYSVSISEETAVVGAYLDTDNGYDSGSAYVYQAYLATPDVLIEQLIDEVITLNVTQGISNSLDAKLEAAMQAIEDVNENNNVAAINSLQAFINSVEAQRGTQISEADADALIAAAQQIIDLLSG